MADSPNPTRYPSDVHVAIALFGQMPANGATSYIELPLYVYDWARARIEHDNKLREDVINGR